LLGAGIVIREATELDRQLDSKTEDINIDSAED
jgi:hypothetical protein